MSDYKFGLVCISMDMQDAGYKFQTMTRKRFNELCQKHDRKHALEELQNRIVNNLIVTEKIIRHCAAKKIAAYRLSSALFPLVTDPTILPFSSHTLNNDEQFVFWLNKIKSAVEETGVRISTHPDQWNSLASLNPQTVEQTIKELNFHGWLLDQCGAKRSPWNPINVHVGLSGKDPDELVNIRYRFLENFKKLDESVKLRLTLENDDKGLWNTENLYNHFRNSEIPLCFDEHHDKVNPRKVLSASDGYFLFVTTWEKPNVPPLFHYSESRPGETNVRAHADMPTHLPTQWWSPGTTEEIYWDVELKMKDRAIYLLQYMTATREAYESGYN